MAAELRKGDVAADSNIADEVEVGRGSELGEAVLAVLEKPSQCLEEGRGSGDGGYFDLWMIWSHAIAHKTKRHWQLLIHVDDGISDLGHDPRGAVETRGT